MKLIMLWEADKQKAYALHNAFEKEENGFINNAYGYSYDEFLDYIKLKHDYHMGKNLPDGFVSDTTYILEVDNDYVGIFNLRHSLTEFLANHAGHIGYGIAKQYRQKGYASAGLKLLIEEAKKVIKEDEIYLCSNKDNPVSLQVQIKNGAYIVGENDNEILTRIRIKAN